MKSISYQDYLIESLKDPEEAAGYLNAALEEGDPSVFLLALQNVIEANGGFSKIAKKSHKSQEGLISLTNNPDLKNTNEILSIIGMHLAVVSNKKSAPRAAHKDDM